MTLLPATTVHTSHQRHSYQTRLLVFKRLHAHTGDRMLTDEKSKPPHTHTKLTELLCDGTQSLDSETSLVVL